MVTPVATCMDGVVLAVQLTEGEESGQAVLANEGRERIAMALQVPRNRIRLVNPVSMLMYHDTERLGAEVQVIRLVADPVAEAREALRETALLRRTRGRSMRELAESEALDLHDSQLAALPKSFGSLTIMEVLKLSNNEITALPDSFGELVALRDLQLHHNELTELPAGFGQLGNLERLTLQQNQLVR